MSDGASELPNGKGGIGELFAASLEFVRTLRRRAKEAAGTEAGDEAAPDAEARQRWEPVLGAARDVFGHVVELGRRVWRDDGDVDVADRLEQLHRRTVQLMASFPDVTELYDDVEQVDAWLEGKLGRPGSESAMRTYLSWVEVAVDNFVRRLVDRAFAEDEESVSPERLAALLEQLDEVVRKVLDRWMLDSTLRPGPNRERGPCASGEDETDG